jgi:hypothetical protein
MQLELYFAGMRMESGHRELYANTFITHKSFRAFCALLPPWVKGHRRLAKALDKKTNVLAAKS